jgi:hypothetical protein
VGAWKVQFADAATPAEAYVFLMPAKEAGLRAVAVGWEAIPASSRTAADGDWWSAEVVTGQAGEHMFLNVRPLLENGVPIPEKSLPNPLAYFPLRYRHQDDGSVKLFTWGGAETISLSIQSGRISGATDGGSVQITADSISLDSFLADAGERAFQVHFATLLPIASPTAAGAMPLAYDRCGGCRKTGGPCRKPISTAVRLGPGCSD